jgi:hypothetical protein
VQGTATLLIFDLRSVFRLRRERRSVCASTRSAAQATTLDSTMFRQLSCARSFRWSPAGSRELSPERGEGADAVDARDSGALWSNPPVLHS